MASAVGGCLPLGAWVPEVADGPMYSYNPWIHFWNASRYADLGRPLACQLCEIIITSLFKVLRLKKINIKLNNVHDHYPLLMYSCYDQLWPLLLRWVQWFLYILFNGLRNMMQFIMNLRFILSFIFLKRSFITLFLLFKVVRFESLPDTLRTLTISYQLLHRVYLIQETCY